MGIKNVLTGVITLGCLTGGPLAGQVFANDIDYEGAYIKLHGGLNFTRDSEFKGSNSETFPSGDATLGGGTIIGLAGGYRFNRNFAADLEYAYLSNDIDNIAGAGGVKIADGGDLASVAIMANGYYYFDFAENWSPYVGLGIGVLQEIDSDVNLVGIADQTDLEDQVFAGQLLVGAEIPINESWRLYGEGRLLTASGPKLTNSNGSYDANYENLSLLVGIGYQF
jgi:opacity protein-like surface antigen